MHTTILDGPPAGAATSRPPSVWDELAATVAASHDRDEVAGIVRALGAELDVSVDTGAPLVVLQRSFGRLHRVALGATRHR